MLVKQLNLSPVKFHVITLATVFPLLAVSVTDIFIKYF